MEPRQTSIHDRGATVNIRYDAWSTEDVKSLRSLARARMLGPQIAKSPAGSRSSSMLKAEPVLTRKAVGAGFRTLSDSSSQSSRSLPIAIVSNLVA
jgi:hypothetical protein